MTLNKEIRQQKWSGNALKTFFVPKSIFGTSKRAFF